MSRFQNAGKTGLTVLTFAGWALFLISFIIPSNFSDERHRIGMGMAAFLATPVLIGGTLLSLKLWLSMWFFAGWSANFLIMPWREPRPLVRVLGALSPWLMATFVSERGSSQGPHMFAPGMNLWVFIPFYCWAVGIGLIQISNLLGYGIGVSHQTRKPVELKVRNVNPRSKQ